MRYLFVTTFPPTHCGIAAYASQDVIHLRERGHLVDVVSPDGAGNVDFAWDLRGGCKILKLLKLLPFYERIIIQYHWAFFYRDIVDKKYRWESLRTTLSFIALWLFGRNKIEVVSHEIPHIPRSSRLSLNFSLYRWKWKLVPRLILHTKPEQENLLQYYAFRLGPSRVQIRAHHSSFRKFREISREAARLELGLPHDATIFLCIGFIQRHKGFDRAIAAFKRASPGNAHLYIVGSLRVVYQETTDYLAELHTLTQDCPNAHLVERFLTDEEFDTWIAASDCVVLPYREIWSSSVLARAHLFDKLAIIAKVGGLPDQARKGDRVFETDEELATALAGFNTQSTATLPICRTVRTAGITEH